MAGVTLKEQAIQMPYMSGSYAVKQPIFPFAKFDKVDPILGPEMRSTGESMGMCTTFGGAYLKAYWGVGCTLPEGGTVFVSVRDADKPGIVAVAKALAEQGFSIVSTQGTYQVLNKAGVRCRAVNKVKQGRPNIVDMIKNDEIVLIINTTQGMQAIADSYPIRTNALSKGIGTVTTLAGGMAVCEALQSEPQSGPVALQDRGLH